MVALRVMGPVMLGLFVALCGLTASPKSFVRNAVKRRRSFRKAQDFESELSVQEMLRLSRQRSEQREAQPKEITRNLESDPKKRFVSSSSVLAPEILQQKPSWLRLKPAAELPCVFTPREEGVRQLGTPVDLKFWQSTYARLWEYACRRTAGAVAVRYSRGSLQRSPHAFALWPAVPSSRCSLRCFSALKQVGCSHWSSGWSQRWSTWAGLGHV